MKRKIVQIDEDLCVGCGVCADACHEDAIVMVNGKAKLMRDDYCDGLGDCLPACPVDAIQIIEREAEAYDEAAVKAHMKNQEPLACGCPGTQVRQLKPSVKTATPDTTAAADDAPASASCLSQWPVQIKLVPVNAPYFNGARLLVAADCTAYAYADFHKKFIRNRITLIGCPKLDSVDYTEKLTEIIRQNDIQDVTIVRMEVPCCGGLEHAVKTALQNSGKFIPWQVVTVTTEGDLLND